MELISRQAATDAVNAYMFELLDAGKNVMRILVPTKTDEDTVVNFLLMANKALMGRLSALPTIDTEALSTLAFNRGYNYAKAERRTDGTD